MKTFRFVVLLAFVTILLYLFGFSSSNALLNRFNYDLLIGKQWNSRSRETWKKWIVVTTNSYPTEALQKLALLKDWKLCVVADTETPKDWKLDGAHFLSIEAQKELQLELRQKLPLKSYTRKTIGYLYAIQNGAEWIYDTDDDIQPYSLGLDQFDYDPQVSGMRYKTGNVSDQKVFNPYRFFGRADILPRGFPSEYTMKIDNQSLYESCSRIATSAVQQGLITAEPLSGSNTEFDRHAPPITLDIGTYAPWNSQNTLFHRNAFFTMFLPTTVEFRASDIWRSFYSQKLLHLIGRTVAFYPVNAIQMRNASEDFEDDRVLYKKSGEIMQFLEDWKCTKNTIAKCAYELAVEFGKNKFWGPEDVKLVKLWLQDLENIGYKFPPISNITSSPSTDCRRAYLHFTANNLKTDDELAREKLENIKDVIEWCGNDDGNTTRNSSNTTFKIKNSKLTIKSLLIPSKIAQKHKSIDDKRRTVLVLVSNFPWKSGIGLQQRLYSGYFAHIIFCGTYLPEKYNMTAGLPKTKMPFSFVHLSEKEMFKGYFHYYCVPKINELRLQNVDGYFFVADDEIFNFWNEFNLSQYGYIRTNATVVDVWWKSAWGSAATKRLKTIVSKKYAHNPEKQSVWLQFMENIRERQKDDPDYLIFKQPGKTFSDFLYIPSKNMSYTSVIFTIFREAELFLEIAVRKFFLSVDTQKLKAKNKSIHLWGKTRANYEKFYNADIMFLHPIKFSFLASKKPRKQFCDSVVSTFVKKLFIK